MNTDYKVWMEVERRGHDMPQVNCWNCGTRWERDINTWPGYCPKCKVDGNGHVKACETVTAYTPTRCRNKREHS